MPLLYDLLRTYDAEPSVPMSDLNVDSRIVAPGPLVDRTLLAVARINGSNCTVYRKRSQRYNYSIFNKNDGTGAETVTVVMFITPYRP